MFFFWGTSVWDLSLGHFRFGHDLSFGMSHSGSPSCELWIASLQLRNLRLGTFVLKRSLGNIRSGTLALGRSRNVVTWELSLDDFRLGSFVRDRSLRVSRVEALAWDASLERSGLGTFAW